MPENSLMQEPDQGQCRPQPGVSSARPPAALKALGQGATSKGGTRVKVGPQLSRPGPSWRSQTGSQGPGKDRRRGERLTPGSCPRVQGGAGSRRLWGGAGGGLLGTLARARGGWGRGWQEWLRRPVPGELDGAAAPRGAVDLGGACPPPPQVSQRLQSSWTECFRLPQPPAGSDF